MLILHSSIYSRIDTQLEAMKEKKKGSIAELHCCFWGFFFPNTCNCLSEGELAPYFWSVPEKYTRIGLNLYAEREVYSQNVEKAA